MTRGTSNRYRRWVGVVLASVVLAWFALWGLEEPVTFASPELTTSEAIAVRPPVRREGWNPPVASPPRQAESVGEVQLTPPSGEVRPTAVIEARVDRRAWVRVVDCEVLSRTRLHGAFRFVVAPGPCVIRGERRDGMLTVFGDQVALAPQAGDHLAVTLPLPEGRMGGIGVRFRPETEGMRVAHLVEGSPAWAAGLEPGDLIVEVNGESTAGMESVEFIQRMTGEEGTGVSFVIGWDGDTGWTEESLEVSRKYLSG